MTPCSVTTETIVQSQASSAERLPGTVGVQALSEGGEICSGCFCTETGMGYGGGSSLTVR